MKKCIVFDLDDTLYKEIDYLKSAFKEIAEKTGRSQEKQNAIYKDLMVQFYSKGDPLGFIIEKYGLKIGKSELLTIYRSHKPNINLDEKTRDMLEIINRDGHILGMITDGRSESQRNKIIALGLDKYILKENILISSETGFSKPDKRCYQYFMEKYPFIKSFVYVGDNVAKDFITANQLGWETFGIRDNGENIHPKIFIDKLHEPKKWVTEMREISFLN